MSERASPEIAPNRRSSPLLPQAVANATVWCLDHVARALVKLGVTANAVTAAGALLAAIGGVLVGVGHFSSAATVMVAASLGDALDGLVARRSGSASASGALLDAAVDRYEEFFFLGGLAVFFRASVAILVMALVALAGSFMVSYGSAKAEGLALPVPAGAMRRAERAVCLCAGTLAAATLVGGVNRGWLPGWAPRVPLIAALAILAIAANVSAVRRLRCVARAASIRSAAVRPLAPAPANGSSHVVSAGQALRAP